MANLLAATVSATGLAARRDAGSLLAWRWRLGLLAVAALCAVFLQGAERVEAASFIVEDGAAVGDGEPGDGVCKSKLRPGTLLRNCTFMAAVEEANALPGHHAILLPAGTFRFDRLSFGDNNLFVTGRMSVIGAGASVTDLKGVGLFDSKIAVLPGGQLEVRNLTYRDSASLSNLGGQLLVENSVIRDNVGLGAGVDMFPPFPLDRVDNPGGHAITTIRNSRITNNKTQIGVLPPARGFVGGINVEGGELILESSLVDGNEGRSNGSVGGIRVHGRGVATLRNVTISGNTSQSGFGGIFSEFQARLRLFNVTITNNSPVGVGLQLSDNPEAIQPNIVWSNVLIANNPGGNCFQTANRFASGSANSLDDGSTCGFAGAVAGSISNVNALIGPLAANGGATPTHALLPGSPAVDTGTCVLLTDQRGNARPLDGDGNGVDLCDIGAFEKARPRPLGGGVGVPVLNPAVSTIPVNETLTESFAWDLPAPTNWGGLGTLDFRLRSPSGAIVFWVHWDQVLDTYQLLDANGRPTGFAFPPGLPVPLFANGVTLDVGGVRTQGSGITGQRATLTLPFRFDGSTVGKTFAIEVSASDDEGRQDPFRAVGTITVVAASSIGPKVEDKEDDVRRLTETQRHQRSRTNQSGLDDERVEGDVVEVRADLQTPEVDIVNRDGVVTLRLVKEAAKLAREIRPGQYVSGDGWKEHEQLYWIEEIDIER